MRLLPDPRLPNPSASGWAQQLNSRLYELFRSISSAFNMGYMWETEGTSAPTSGTWEQGNFCRNTSPSEAGTVGNKYVVIGWVCTVSGSPGTWVQMRTLTGN